MAAVAERLPFETAAPLPRLPRSRAAVLIRRALQAALLFPLVRRLCRPLRVEGARRLRQADGPFVFVANHESHADTAVVLAALPREVRSRSAPAAAEDYFFSSRVRGVMAALAMGAFPFPRHGSAGLERA